MTENPNEIISVSGGGTNRGIKSIIDGTAQVAMASSDINKELSAKAEEKGIKLVKHIIAYDAIVPFVNPKNTLSDVTIDNLKKIYTGRITKWKDVGGKNANIKLITRNFDSGTFEGWKLLVIGNDSVISPQAVPMESLDMKRLVTKDINAIGYSAFNYIDNTVKPLSVNGVMANKNTINSGSYPLKRELILYTRSDVSENASRFIEYAKKNASKYTDKAGVFPIK
jgi:phosphate transport system substrate-binding protein